MRRKISLFLLFCTACALLGACAGATEPSAVEIPAHLRSEYTLADDLLGEDKRIPAQLIGMIDVPVTDFVENGAYVQATFDFIGNGTYYTITTLQAHFQKANGQGEFSNCTAVYRCYNKFDEVSIEGEIPLARQESGNYVGEFTPEGKMLIPMHKRFELIVSGDYTLDGETETLTATAYVEKLKVPKFTPFAVELLSATLDEEARQLSISVSMDNISMETLENVRYQLELPLDFHFFMDGNLTLPQYPENLTLIPQNAEESEETRGLASSVEHTWTIPLTSAQEMRKRNCTFYDMWRALEGTTIRMDWHGGNQSTDLTISPGE